MLGKKFINNKPLTGDAAKMVREEALKVIRDRKIKSKPIDKTFKYYEKEHKLEYGLYDILSDTWKFYSIKDAEEHTNEVSDCDLKNWNHTLNDFKNIFGKYWLDKKDVLYLLEGKPIYHKYKIIGVEDSNSWADYYWILEDANGKRKYELANCRDFYENIISYKKR